MLEPPRSPVDDAGQVTEAGRWRQAGLSRAGLGRFLRAAQAAVGLGGEVDVLLADDRTLRRLNREFRGKNKPTDVLSFPAARELAGGQAGDLAISLETAGRQGMEQGHTLRDEVRVLLLHGLLHLAGMDHETDEGEMAGREAELRVQLRLPNGLIARVGAGARSHPSGQRPPAGGARFASEKQVPRCARNDNQKGKSNSNSQSKGKSQSRSESTSKRSSAGRSGVGSVGARTGAR